jgi:nitrous oxidase accessory protein
LGKRYALLLVLIFLTTSYMSLLVPGFRADIPLVKAQTIIETTAFLSAEPNPVGVGQMVKLDMLIEPPPPPSAERLSGLIVNFTFPDYTTEHIGPLFTNSNGSAFTHYVPTMVGTHTLRLSYFGESFENGEIIYNATSATITLNVTQEPQPTPTPTPEPTPTPTPTPEPQPSASFIQTLINSASPGDTIHVPAGNYVGQVNVNKTVKLVGESSSSTIIDGGFAGDVVEVSADNVEISGFTVQNSGPRGIGVNIEYCTGSKIYDNIMKNNYEGLVVGGSSNASVYENKIVSNFGNLGVMINYSTSVTFSRNYVRKNVGQGLVVFHCSSCIVSENQIVENDDKSVVWSVGMVLSNSFSVKVFGNNITANADHGLNLVGSSSNEIFRNVMSKNADGICLSGSTNNDIYENTLQANAYGVECWFASNNRIYHNNIIGNDGQVYNFGTEQNVWDKGYASGGNYWSDYVGNDTDNDGIGDTPYLIDENNQDDYPLMAQFSTSIVIPSPSPSPSPTPSPAPSPTPPPKQATPTIAISCKGTSASSGFKVEIKGKLSCNGAAISEETVLISYSVTGGDEWENLTLVNTGSDGSFIAVWMPSASGNYLVKALWEGNSEFNEASTTVNFALKAYSEESVFSLTSNSTITEFAFNSTSKELTFTASGPFGTTGYVNVYIPKSLASDISDLKVYVDGYPITYSSESQSDSWVVSFIYSHSTHNIVINLSAPSSSETRGSVTEFIYVIAAVAIALAITAIVSIRKDLKGKTVREVQL